MENMINVQVGGKTIQFPSNLTGLNWLSPAMTAPPAERTHVGSYTWVNTLLEYIGEGEDQIEVMEDKRIEYFVLPDGSAEKVETTKPFSECDKAFVEQKEEKTTYPAGTWYVDYPVGVTFGGRSGVFLRPIEVVEKKNGW